MKKKEIKSKQITQRAQVTTIAVNQQHNSTEAVIMFSKQNCPEMTEEDQLKTQS